MKTLHLVNAFTACLLVVAAGIANASVIYTYAGNNYTTTNGSTFDTSMSVYGSIELASEIGASFSGAVSPIAYSFSDGVNSYTELNSEAVAGFSFSTNASGQITYWNIILQTPPFAALGLGDIQSVLTTTVSYDSVGLRECMNVSGGTCNSLQYLTENGNVFGDPGAWTVPVPAAVWLFGSGLLGLIGVARRKKSA